MLFPEASTRLRFRLWREEDIESFAKMNADAEVMEYFPSILSQVETIESVNRIQKHFDDYGFGLYAIEKKEKTGFIGFTGFSTVRFESSFTPCTEIGWRLDKREWGKGYAIEAARACLEFGFSRLCFNSVVSFTSVLNWRSEQVMKKVGMTRAFEFEHPLILPGNRLKTHILYRLAGKDWKGLG